MTARMLVIIAVTKSTSRSSNSGNDITVRENKINDRTAPMVLPTNKNKIPYAIDRGCPLELAQTMSLNMLVVLEIFHLFFIRNIHGTSLTWDAVKGTRVVWTVVIVITAAQFAVTYLHPLQAILGTKPVPLADGLLIVGVGAAFFAIIEIEKQIRLGLKGSRYRNGIVAPRA